MTKTEKGPPRGAPRSALDRVADRHGFRHPDHRHARLGRLEAFTRDATPPDLSIQVLVSEKTASGHRITFDVSNAATTTAAAVTVIGG